MYQIYADGRLLHDPRHSSAGLVVDSPKVNLEVNKVGSCTFTILPTHPLYSSLYKLMSIIDVYDNDELLFRGRILNDDIDFNNKKAVTCEGELAYLNDSICGRVYGQAGITYATVEEWFSFLLNLHNGPVFGISGDSQKEIQLGTVSDFGNHAATEQSDPGVTTWSVIESDFLNVHGGYLRLRYDGSTKYLDYVDDLEQTSNQVIEFGKNLLDLTQHISAEDVFTRLFPYGEDKTVHMDIDTSQENTGIILENETGIALFGRITKAHQWSWVTADTYNRSGILKILGEQYLKDSIAMATSIDITGFDLTLAGVNTEKIHVGDKVRIVSLPHNLDQYFLCSSISYDLANPGNNEYSFGYSKKDLTEQLLT